MFPLNTGWHQLCSQARTACGKCRVRAELRQLRLTLSTPCKSPEAKAAPSTHLCSSNTESFTNSSTGAALPFFHSASSCRLGNFWKSETAKSEMEFTGPKNQNIFPSNSYHCQSVFRIVHFCLVINCLIMFFPSFMQKEIMNS